MRQPFPDQEDSSEIFYFSCGGVKNNLSRATAYFMISMPSKSLSASLAPATATFQYIDPGMIMSLIKYQSNSSPNA